ncbi:MAG: hypothetical protein HC871_10360 [Rhizobiales bacterium]|nr:hypothetical protein [Hyphomicrobiales bacterium]
MMNVLRIAPGRRNQAFLAGSRIGSGATRFHLVGCPHHLIPAITAEHGGMRPGFRRQQRDSLVEDTPLATSSEMLDDATCPALALLTASGRGHAASGNSPPRGGPCSRWRDRGSDGGVTVVTADLAGLMHPAVNAGGDGPHDNVDGEPPSPERPVAASSRSLNVI